MYDSHFQKHVYDESVLCRFEDLTKFFYKWNEYRPYYATQYPVIFIQHNERFNFVTGKASHKFKDEHLTV